MLVFLVVARTLFLEFVYNPVFRFVVGLLIVFLLLVLSVKQCHAQAAYNGVVNDSIYRTISTAAQRMGFAANDNRILQTATAVGQRAAVTATSEGAASVAGSAARALMWLPVMGRRALMVGGAVLLTAGIQWAVNSQGQVAQTVPNTPGVVTALNAGGAYMLATFNAYGESCGGSTITAVAQACIPVAADLDVKLMGRPAGSVQSSSCTNTSNSVACTATYYVSATNHGTDVVFSVSPAIYSSGAPLSCTSGMMYNGGCYTPPPNSTTAYGTTWNATDALPSTVKTQALDPSLVATSTDAWWKEAAQQAGYQGLPYTYSNPVTAQDAEAAEEASPSTWPMVSDALDPVASGAQTGTTISSIPIPGNTSSTGPLTSTGPVSTGTGAEENLGTDPGTPAPTLEATPTAAQIVGPLTSLFPGLRAFSVPGHQSACPQPSMTIFDKTVSITSHCTLLEQNRALIGAVMVAFWAVTALLVVLRA